MNKHTDDKVCASCEDKLTEVHPSLARWYRTKKERYPNLHISWGYRSAADQNRLLIDGKTKLQYPNSKHNKTDMFGSPRAEALDLFLIGEDGEAAFPMPFYRLLAAESKAWFEPIRWGGNFTRIVKGKSVPFADGPHFELIPPLEPKLAAVVKIK